MFLEGYIEDITERKRTEIRLTESENKFRKLFYGHAAVKLIVDPENDSIADANEAAAEFYGWSIEELKKMKVAQVNALPPEEVHKLVQKTKALKNSRFEVKHRKAGGEIVDVEIFASNINIGGKEFLHVIIHDITEKKKIEDALRESEERNRLIMDNSMDAILLTKPAGEVISANKSACQMFGMSENEIRAAGRKGLVDLDDTRLPELLKQRELNSFAMGELRFVRKDGTKFPAEISSSVFRSSRDEIYTSLVIRDITERKNWENELIRAKEKAEVNDKLKSAFLANMSHEIRTPMNSILGFLDLIDAPDLENETRHEYIKLVNKSGQRLLSTINDIIEISKIETGVHEVVYSRLNVREMMQFYLEFFRLQAAEKGIELVISEQITEEKALIKTDKNKLNSILTNLINNAIKFTSRGEIQLGVYEEKGSLVFYVKDTGCGIPAGMLDAVFDRFMQVDVSLSRAHEGSGLGLPITKAYIELLGGNIRVESEVGRGSTFIFLIPYLPVQTEIESVSGKLKPMEDSLAGKTILIAEDDETSYEFLEAILKVKKVRIIHTYNGTDTLEAFGKNPDVSVILMDIKMPGMDGYEATKEIRKLNGSIPVIAQTAYALPGDREKAIEAGCDDYISKPIKAEELYAMIRKYI